MLSTLLWYLIAIAIRIIGMVILTVLLSSFHCLSTEFFKLPMPTWQKYPLYTVSVAIQLYQIFAAASLLFGASLFYPISSIGSMLLVYAVMVAMI